MTVFKDLKNDIFKHGQQMFFISTLAESNNTCQGVPNTLETHGESELKLAQRSGLLLKATFLFQQYCGWQSCVNKSRLMSAQRKPPIKARKNTTLYLALKNILGFFLQILRQRGVIENTGE